MWLNMIDFTAYNLIKKDEKIQAYNFQQDLLENEALSVVEKGIKISILLAEYMDDYETPIQMLHDLSKYTSDYQILILGAYWDNFWPIYSPNPFLCQLKRRYDEFDEETKAVIKCLEAMGLYSAIAEDKRQRKKYKKHLQESISLCDHLFTPYYYMAIMNAQKVDKNWIIKGLSKIEKLISHDEYLKMDMQEEISYEWYYKKYITRTVQTRDEVYSFAEL